MKTSKPTAFYIADNPNTPASVLEEIYNTYNNKILVGYMYIKLSYNKNTPVHILEQLASKKIPSVCENIMWNPSAPKYLKLYKYYSDYI